MTTYINNIYIKPFHAISLFLYPLKISENRRFFIFTEEVEGDQWHDIGQTNPSFIKSVRLDIDIPLIFYYTKNQNKIYLYCYN